jgi:hypothetical protein
MMALLLTVMVASQTRTEVPGIEIDGLGAAQGAGVVGTLMVKTDLAVVAEASGLIMIAG